MSTLENPSNETWASHLEPELCGDTRHWSSTGSFCCSSPALTLAPIRADSTRSGCREHNARFMHCPTEECRYLESRYLSIENIWPCMTAWALCPGYQCYQCYLVLSRGGVSPYFGRQVPGGNDEWQVTSAAAFPLARGDTPPGQDTPPAYTSHTHCRARGDSAVMDNTRRIFLSSTMRRPHFVLSDLLWTAVVYLPHKTKSEMLVKYKCLTI